MKHLSLLLRRLWRIAFYSDSVVTGNWQRFHALCKEATDPVYRDTHAIDCFCLDCLEMHFGTEVAKRYK